MRVIHRTVLGLASVAAVLGGASTAHAANTSANVSSGTTSLHAEVKQRLGTEIDSGWMDQGLIKVRTRFTIDPVQPDPLLTVDMPEGAKIEASWNEKGFINLKPVTGERATGTAKVHFTLVPSLEASIYGVAVSYNGSQLVNMLPGGKFGFDAQKSGPLSPWGFAGASVQTPGPALDKSTIFALPFSTLGVGTGTATGTLSIQATTSPTFKYVTKEVRLDGASVTAADGVAKVPVSDGDFMEVVALVNGELTFNGDLDIRPVVQVDSVAGYPTYGLVKFSFSAVKKAYSGAPTVVNFAPQTIHIPLPNVKVPTQPIGLGAVKAGGKAEKTVSIDSTGELGAVLTFSSSDPQFTVPSGEVRVPAKGKYDLKVAFSPKSDGPASTTITVHSNDPDSPDQTFKIGANGASLDPDEDEDGPKKGQRPGEGVPDLPDPGAQDGCSASPVHGSAGNAWIVGIGLAIANVLRRRRPASR
jgi:hypothetical protein